MYYIWRSNLRLIENTTRSYDDDYAFASTNKKLQSILSFEWNEQDGFKIGTNNGVWDFIIPESKQQVLENDCSLYALDPTQCTVYDAELEIYLLKFPVRIYREEKYKNVEECLRKHGVNIIIQKQNTNCEGYLAKRIKNITNYKILSCSNRSWIYYSVSEGLKKQ